MKTPIAVLLLNVMLPLAAGSPASADPDRPDFASALPHGPEQAGYRHLIFYDTSDNRFQAAWARQAGLLQGQLRAMGVPAENISITPLSSREDFFCALSGSEGPRQVYFFGHGSPLTMHIGTEQVDVGADAQALQEQQVRLVAHYGCSFVNVNSGDLRTLQGNMQPGTSITLVGHRDLSDPFDDRWWDRDNPLMRVTVTPNTSTMYSVHDELRNRVVPALGLLLGTPGAGPLPSAAGAAARWQAAEYYGPAPTTMETDIARQAAALLGNAAGGPLPALAPPVDPRFGARFVPKYRSGH